MNSKTLTLKKPAQAQEQKTTRPEKVLVGKQVRLQTKSKHVLIGTIVSFDGGWIVVDGAEYHWQADGQLSGMVTSGRYTLDRSTVQFVAEVDHE